MLECQSGSAAGLARRATYQAAATPIASQTSPRKLPRPRPRPAAQARTTRVEPGPRRDGPRPSAELPGSRPTLLPWKVARTRTADAELRADLEGYRRVVSSDERRPTSPFLVGRRDCLRRRRPRREDSPLPGGQRKRTERNQQCPNQREGPNQVPQRGRRASQREGDQHGRQQQHGDPQQDFSHGSSPWFWPRRRVVSIAAKTHQLLFLGGSSLARHHPTSFWLAGSGGQAASIRFRRGWRTTCPAKRPWRWLPNY